MNPGRTCSTARRKTAALAASIAACLTLQLALLGASSAERSGPPPTPVPSGGSPSPFPQSLATPADAVASPRLDAPAAILAELDHGQVMFAKAPRMRRPIASLTKVMTALIVLERRDLEHVVEITPAAIFDDDEYGASSILGLRAGERRTIRQLLDALMLQSANDAALALAIEIGGTQQGFVDLMNERAQTLGLRRTEFFSPNGLDDRGRSSVRDLLVLTRAAYAAPGFAQIVASRFRTIPAPRGRPRRVQNRNALLWLYPGAIGAKTGFTAVAGYCLIATAEREGRRLIVVVLGDRNEAFSEVAALLDHGFEAFEERTFVRAGQGIGTVAIRGGAVAVEAARSITSLVPTAQIDSVREQVAVLGDAVFPPAQGERVGTLTVSIPGAPLGSSALIVADVPPPPPSGDDPWWQRAAGALGRSIGQALGGLLG